MAGWLQFDCFRVVHAVVETLCHCVAGIQPTVRDPPRDTGWRRSAGTRGYNIPFAYTEVEQQSTYLSMLRFTTTCLLHVLPA